MDPDAEAGGDDVFCMICLDPIRHDCVNSLLLECSHSFHATCLLEYAVSCGQRNTVLACPVCRDVVVGQMHVPAVEVISVDHVVPIRNDAWATAPRLTQSQKKYLYHAIGMLLTAGGCMGLYWAAIEGT